MRSIRWAAFLVAAAGLGTFVYTLNNYPLRGQVAASNPGLTAKVVIQYFGETGKLARTETYTEAVRTDGSVSRLRETVDGRADSIGTVLDVTKAARITFDPLGKTVTTYHLKSGEMKALAEPGPKCSIPEDASQQLVLGYFTYHFKEDHTFGTKTIQEEKWVAPALDCFPMKRSYDVWDSGQYKGRTEGRVVSLTVGTPDPSLFDIPKDYVERTPTEAMAIHAEKLGARCGACSSRSGQSLDQAYESHQ